MEYNSEYNMENTTTNEEDFLAGLLTSLDENRGEENRSEDTLSEYRDEYNNVDSGISKRYFDALEAEALRLLNDPEFNAADADIRFSTAMNLRAVRNTCCCIIGAGGLGNWQWRILLSMGFRQVVIYDDDMVSIENIGPQAHSIFDIGLPKVEGVRRAALQYRGIGIVARNKRVMTLSDIHNDLGYVPDVIIGCTDSADFRNSFIGSLERTLRHSGSSNPSQLPQLWIDYRMALGDWNAYIVPARAMVMVPIPGWSVLIDRFFTKYRREACFDASDAVQEACTERAISYTGASVASFTGALLHWWFSTGKQELSDSAKLHNEFLAQKGTQFSWKMSYSSRDFEPISPTRREAFLMGKLADEKRRSAYKEETLTNFLSAYTGIKMTQVWRTGSVDDLLESYPGAIHIFEETMQAYIEFPDGKYRRLNVQPSRIPGNRQYSIGETIDDTTILGWYNITRYICIPGNGSFFSLLAREDPEEPVIILPKGSDGMQTYISILKTQDFIDRNGGGFRVGDFGTGYVAEVYTQDNSTEEYRIMSIADLLNKYQDFLILEDCESRVDALRDACMRKRNAFVEFARSMTNMPSESGAVETDLLGENTGTEENTDTEERHDVAYIDSHDLVPGNMINLGAPGENYLVLETGVRLKLREVTTGDEFFCRHFSSRVMRVPHL